MISLEIFLSLFLMAGLGLVFGLWWYYDRRDRHLFDEQRLQRAYCCLKCETLYLGPQGPVAEPCPRCGFHNSRLQF